MTESTLNQYAPPRAHVADLPSSAVAELKVFSAQGRIGRLRYLAYGTGASVIYYIGLTALLFGLGGTASSVATVLAAVVVIWFSVITGIKRCHDINISGWWTLTMIVPVIVFVWIFWPGGRGDNRFGPPPPPNTLGVKLLGLIMPVIFFVGILAAVAIPQYKMYTDKARAAQAAGPR
ncbi:MAG: DUF805 domain-containing protein [Roseateles sp.]|uniref:DUF805 domain-containing protein n=1 Tax=Roseateles sp. TaxID=1971397 RepID=UPI004036C29F